MGKSVNGAVIVLNTPSLADERADDTVEKIVAATTQAVKRYDTDGRVPTGDAKSLEHAVMQAWQIGADTDGADVIAIAFDGDTTDVDKSRVCLILEDLDDDTFVLFVVATNQPHAVDSEFLDALDNRHPKADQIDVIYVGEEDIAEVIGREIDEFLQRIGASA